MSTMNKHAKPDYTPDQLATIDKLEADVSIRLAPIPHRLAHSLSVGECAESLALTYHVDAFNARVAGILHDWDKVLSHEELLSRSRELGLDMGVDLELVQPLLHGIVAARELPDVYPWLKPEVLQAIARHTTGAADMTPLDEVIFVADGIEPRRRASAGIQSVRDHVGAVSLDDLYWESFCGGITYVVDGGRYLYPGTIDIYNVLVEERNHTKEHA